MGEKAAYPSIGHKRLMGLHFPKDKGIIMPAALISCANFARIGIKGIMGGFIGATGNSADKTTSFGIPAVMPLFSELQRSAIKADIAWLRWYLANDTALGVNPID